MAERDWLVLGLNGQPNGDLYYFLDPANCGNVANQYGGTVVKATRPGRGAFCGTTQAGYYTLDNGDESTQGYLHASDDINDNIQLFTDILLNHDVTRFNHGTAFLDTADDGSSPYTYYSDPNVPGGDLLNLQQIYTPEEVGNLRGQDDKDTNNSIRATIGIQGALWSTDWKYTVDMTYTENKLTEATHLAFTNAINDFYAPLFGPDLGPDPIYGQPQYAVDYAAFYKPITPAQYASFTGYATSYSRTEDSLARAQLTNSSLFALPGGNAGIALLIEGGGQGWEYDPDPRYLDGETYLYTATAGSGHRSRYAGTVEMRLPVIDKVTIDASTRYDDYRVSGENVDKFTYNLGIEFRPLSSLLIRGRYGTAFKAPTLSDQFQGTSGFYTDSATDYYTCTKQGFASHLADCPYANTSFFGTTEGNRQLKPITAKVADGGIVWSPFEHSAFTVDYLHWKINNEVEQQDSDQLLRTDSACLLGQLDINSPTCVTAISQVTRDANGLIVQIDTPKQNLSEETLNVVVFGLNYTWVTGVAGNFTFEGSYSNVLKHTFVQFAGDAEINFLDSPFYSTEFKTKENLSVSWDFHKFGATFYVERYGQTPNYAAALTVAGYYGPDAAPGAARLGTWTIANMSAKYEVFPGLEVSANVVNLFDKSPPADDSYTGISNQPYNVFNYNDYGRSFFVQANYKLGK